MGRPFTQPETDELLSPAQVAQMLGVSPITVRSWVTKGWLEARITPGGHRRFTRTAVAAFIQRRQPLQGSAPSQVLRVLVVDDDAQFRGFLLDLLENWAPAIVADAAVDGFEAGLKVNAFRPDLILLDETMPGLNGASVCRRIKQDPQHAGVRVIGMTGYHSPQIEAALLEAGAECVLHKPIEIAVLRQLLGVSK